jgi:hypothetical protein
MFSLSEFSIPELSAQVKRLSLETDWLVMGRILKHLSKRMKRDKHKELLDNIDLSDRTAFYLIAIITRLDSQMITVPKGVGWRKLAEVSPMINYDNHKAIFEKILSHTREELIEMKRLGTLTRRDNNGTLD